MRKYLFLIAFLVLGTMISSCSSTETIVDQAYYDSLRACEPQSETHYLSWFTNYRGEVLSTSIPYICPNEENTEYEVFENDSNVVFKDMTIHKIATNYSIVDDVEIIEFKYKVVLRFNNFKSTYYFNSEEHQSVYGLFPLYEPEFELVKCDIKNLGISEEGDKHYDFTSVELLLTIKQGEMVFELPKLLVVKDRRFPIEFNPSVDGWEDENVDLMQKLSS